ncbi:MAG TPA: hypothetical protein VFV61_02675 [Pyrinomonadaceae bacterium]|nr:hypothetical protein [Pyrinomonadaceae bacterium]
MKRWQKALLITVVLLLISQIPFAYRRFKLGKLHAAILTVQSQRQPTPDREALQEFRGVVHVHSFLGGHSSGTFQEIIAAANSNQLNFVLMTEHPAREFSTAEMTLKGEHGGVLFINGNEVSASNGDRLLLFPGEAQAASDNPQSTQEILSQRSTGISFVAYPEDFKSWDAHGFNGVEVYNLYTDARKINALKMFFDGLWSYNSYPDLLFATFYQRPAANLKSWDEVSKSKNLKLVAIAGNDAHANVGVALTDSSGNTLLGLKLDPYERSFRIVRLHVLAAPLHGATLNEATLLDAISSGHCFIGFDVFGDSSGFRFTATTGREVKQMGDEITLVDRVQMNAKVPVPARIVLLKDGVIIEDKAGFRELEYLVTEKGTYRVEVYLPQLPAPVSGQPWIISNPIYVR